jgi:hypothetical protein
MGKVHDLPVTGNKQFLLQQLVTVADLIDFKTELLVEIKRIIETQSNQPVKKWLKSYEVEKLLDISSNTLLTWRNNGTVPYSPLGGIYYYDPAEIEKLLQSKRQGGWKAKRKVI